MLTLKFEKYACTSFFGPQLVSCPPKNVYGPLRARSLLGAVITSNTIGLVIDSVLFVPMAFGSFTAVPGQILGKTVATVLTVAVLVTAKAARRTVRR